MINRRKTKQIKVGGVKVGGSAPISIQSMAKVETSNVRACISQIKKLENAGCEIVRVAVKNLKDAEAIKDIKRGIKIPLVADIHFDYRLALAAIKSGADKIRLNPGNMRKKNEIEEVVRAAKKAKIPMRIGLNSGSISTDMIKAALDYIKLFEEKDFHDIIVSLKASDVAATVEAYREISKRCDYPMHLGVTAAGPYDSGIVKSAVGIGALLLDGIGDTIRVSLTADPVEEVVAARRILSALNLRRFGPEIISCPACGRCQVNLAKMVDEVGRRVQGAGYRDKKIRIAIMGCEVNGPGEAREADIGIAFGKGSGVLFEKGKIVKKVAVKNAVGELLKNL
ncbi:MAG: flavodoxin-dependent (E)-4-hydroxy-3-methylbut-2-enyl-diphosphate synthase [Candidatus Omnitrophota bacterium]|jgi:(E)-4-hydroxy-3-methylbut-2-enyl-diphosphate synthase